ncbi:Potassium channel AKT1 [Hibiscus syriacus]|uniref:Potassium channel AKT1 n=1 Tax=Hibiscus syriacus TaxID=106335 RepID=A0A6A2XLD8_HIBSY|nr:Potassium channel AKT1 [Hibiscus syriacus]
MTGTAFGPSSSATMNILPDSMSSQPWPPLAFWVMHLKDKNDPIMEGVLIETENMLARGRMDLPLNLCFATLRGDDLLLHQLLKRGLDPNEADNNGRTALHIAASKGSENCILLLLDYGADPNCKDSEGNVPLWEAMLAGHDSVAKLLKENRASITSGDIGHYACTAAEQNNLNLLKEIVQYRGDVTRPRHNGYTALHVAVCEGNIEIVKYLMDQGADIDKLDVHGWTPRDLAEQQGHEEIKTMFESEKKRKLNLSCRFRRMPRHGTLGGLRVSRLSVLQHQMRKMDRGANPGRGVGQGVKDDPIVNPSRVVISCLEKGQTNGKLVLLPGNIEKLLEIGAKKFGIFGANVVSKGGAEIDDIEVIRDGDHIVFVSDGRQMLQHQQQTTIPKPQCNGFP